MLLSLKEFCCRKEACGYEKIIHEKKKNKEKSIEKWTSVRDI
jgi:hypothetical protein